jgi:glycogen synthase
MHVLHIIQRFYPFVGGSETYFLELSERLVRDGHRVTVLTTDAWDLDHFWAPNRRTIDEPATIHNGIEIRRFPVVRAPGPPIVYPILRRLMVELGRLPATTPLLKRMAQITPRVPAFERFLATTTTRYDLINTANITLDFMLLPALRFAQRTGTPFVCTPFVHLGEPGSRYIVRYYAMRHQLDLLRRSRLVITQTDLERAFLHDRGVPGATLRTIGCWVRPDTLADGDGARFRQAYAITGPVVLSLGAAAYDKGTMHTIGALQQLWRAGSDATLVLIAGTTLAQFEQFWTTLPEPDKQRIRLIPSAPHQTKLDALAAADVYVQPSRTESFGLPFLEAWLYDVPVIGARAGGVPDVINDEEDGLLVPFGDVPQLSAAIQRLLDDRSAARAMGQRGHAKVLRSLTLDHVYARLLHAYTEVAADAG